MGTIAVIEATVDTQISTDSADSTFINVVTTGNLVAGKVYYVICSASVEGANANDLFEWRLYDNTNGEVLEDSTTIRESTQSGNPQSYYYVGRFTAGILGIAGLSFQQKGYASPDYRPARTNFLSMLLLDMSDMDSGDYFFENDNTHVENSETMADRVVHTQADVVEDDNWLVFGWIAHQVNNTTKNTESEMTSSEGVSADKPFLSFEGEDASEEIQWWMCRAYTISGLASGVTWKMRARVDASTDESYTVNSTLFGIRLSSLTDSYQEYTSTALNPSDTEFFELARNSFTPTITGKVIVAATSIFDAGGSFRKAGQRIQKDGTTIPNTQPDTENFLNSNDATDELPLSYITVYDGIKDTAAQIDYDGKSSVGTSAVAFDDITLAIFGTSTTIAPINFTAIAKQVYTRGDVASETLVAGSRATQTLASGDVEAQGFTSGDKASDTNASGDVAGEVNPE